MHILGSQNCWQETFTNESNLTAKRSEFLHFSKARQKRVCLLVPVKQRQNWSIVQEVLQAAFALDVLSRAAMYCRAVCKAPELGVKLTDGQASLASVQNNSTPKLFCSF